MSGYPNHANFSQREFEMPEQDKPMGSPTYSQSGSQGSSNETSEMQLVQTYSGRFKSADPTSSHRTFHLTNPFQSKSKKPFEPKVSNDKVEKVQKRRGPKPDSKPAQNRRQELNRAAQRTHRERKEAYMRDLEMKNQKCQDNCEQLSSERDDLAQVNTQLEKSLKAAENENRYLKQLLIDNNIHVGRSGSQGSNQSSAKANPSAHNHLSLNTNGLDQGNTFGVYGGLTTSHQPTAATDAIVDGANLANTSFAQGSLTPSNTPAYTRGDSSAVSVLTTPLDSYATSPQVFPPIDHSSFNASAIPTQELPPLSFKDPNDETFIAFVVDLEETCKGHMGYMMERLTNVDSEDVSGHALMFTAPSMSQIQQHPGEYEHRAPRMAIGDLNRLLENSRFFNRNGEVTPIMALHMITGDERFPLLSREDFYQLQKSLKAKSRCYGFGAVLEDFEIIDAMDEACAKYLAPSEFTYKA